MKIIKSGVVKSELIYRGTCHSCGCIIECEKKELTSEYDIRDQQYFHYLDCPTKDCGRRIWTTVK